MTFPPEDQYGGFVR